MIILDFETNSQNIGDVIEVAAVRVKKENDTYIVLDKFHRYYLSRYPVNYHSYAVHRLTPELILEYREDKDYVSYFTEDEDFIEFCKEPDTLIAHNISFELRHIDKMASFTNHICTMRENKQLIQAKGKTGKLKNPSLNEVCEYFDVVFDESQHHSATYDVTKTFEVLKKMEL